MISSVEKAANAMSGKTARACDGCLRRRARWYCAADDAFLCQTCDASVHSANQLARRHDRIRLQTSSSLNTSSAVAGGHLSPAPAWHGRKPRTPRRSNKRVEEEEESCNYFVMETPVVVPELGSEEGSMDENDFDDQMLCRVPVFEPFDYDQKVEELECFNEFLPADLDLTEFAADVESLLGGAEMIETAAATYGTVFYKVPVKTEAHHHDVLVSNVIKTTSTDDSPVMINGKSKEVEEEIKVVIPTSSTCNYNNEEAGHQEEMKREKLLRLNYESVIAAWTGQASPWTTGTRPEFKWGGVCWPELPEYDYNPKGGRGDDGEREARVLRYKEKRRTRLFSKKIRYEVRKLNAEKRPRMKGRFVKRTTTSFINGDFTTPFSLYS